MSRRQPNLIDRIAGLIPGYRGYAERSSRRAEDRQLRDDVAARLVAIQRDVDGSLLRRIDSGQLQGMDALDRLKRELGRCADALRHAPDGGSGLMDDIVVKEADLDRVHAHDQHLAEFVDEIAREASAAARADDAGALLSLQGRLGELNDLIQRRDEVMRQVFD